MNNLQLFPGDRIILNTSWGIGIQEIFDADERSITRKIVRCDWAPTEISDKVTTSSRAAYAGDWQILESYRVKAILSRYGY